MAVNSDKLPNQVRDFEFPAYELKPVYPSLLEEEAKIDNSLSQREI